MDFETTFPLLLSINNDHRAHAEKRYHELVNHSPADTAFKLLSVIAGSSSFAKDQRILALVLIRRLIDPRSEAWAAMSSDLKSAIQERLWHIFTTESDPSILSKVSHAIAKGSEVWTDLVPGLVETLRTSPDTTRQAAVFSLIEQMAEYNTALRAQATGLISVFQTALIEGMPLVIRMAALRALLGLVLAMSREEELKAVVMGQTSGKKAGAQKTEGFRTLAPMAVETLMNCVSNAEKSQARQDLLSVVQLYTEVVELAPKFLQGQMEALLTVSMQLLQQSKRENRDPGVEEDSEQDNIHNATVELLLTLCQECPASIRKISGFPQAFLAHCMYLSTCVDESLAEWDENLEALTSEDDSDDPSSLGDQAVHRLLQSLGGKTMLPIAASLLPTWLNAQGAEEQWKQRRAALVLLAAVFEHSKKLIKTSVAEVTHTAVHHLQDPCPRVVAEALKVIKAIIVAAPDQVTTGLHSCILPSLLTIISQSERSFRTRGLAISTLSILVTEGKWNEEHSLDTYIDSVLSALVTCLQPTTPMVVQEVTLEAVSALASESEASFAKHYSAFMPGLKSLLASPKASLQASGPDAALRDRVIECIGLVGSTVGKEIFAIDAGEVMDYLIRDLQHLHPENISLERLGAAMGHICQAMGERFVAYLGALVPLLIRTAEVEVDLEVQNVDDDTQLGLMDDGQRQAQVLDIPGVGKQRISLNTYAVLEKAAALDTIDRYARTLTWRFVEWAERLPPLLIPMITARYSEQVRTSAALCAASNLDCFIEATKRGMRPIQQAQQLLLQYLTPIVNQLEAELSHESRQYMAQALRDILQTCAESGGIDSDTGLHRATTMRLSSIEGRALTLKVREAMVSSLDRRGQAERQVQEDEQLDEEDEQALLDVVGEEAELMSHLTDCIGYLIKCERAEYLPTFEQEVLPILQALIGPKCGNPVNLVSFAICLFDDVIEYGGQGAQKYLEGFLPLLNMAWERSLQTEEQAEATEEELIMLRQACVYGITQICKHAPNFLQQSMAPMRIFERLLQLLQAPNANVEPQRTVTENAISAIFSICQAVLVRRIQAPMLGQQGLPSLHDLLGLCLAHLPLYEDKAESKLVHRQLADMLEDPQGTAALLGKLPNVNGPLLHKIVTEICQMARKHMDREELDNMIAEPVTVTRLEGSLQRLGQVGVQAAQ